MRPLDRLPSIRAKLGSVIVFAVAVTILIMYITVGFALRASYRDRVSRQLIGEANGVAALAFNPSGVPAPNLARVIGQVQDQVLVVDASGKGLAGRFSPPPALARVLAGSFATGTVGNREYLGVPVFRQSRVVGAVFLAHKVAGGGVWGAVLSTAALLRLVWWQLLLAGAISAFIALGLARILARGMTQPIREMARATARMATGDYGSRVSVQTRDELGRLADNFNHMAGEMENVERLRRDLVANVSHELKTPISALRAHLENLLDGVEEPNPETLQVMLDQSERLTRLVEELLDLSRLESGDVPLRLEPVELLPLVGQVAREIEVGRPDGPVEFRNAIAAGLPPVVADPERLHQVLFNLLDNAFRFTPAGGSVTVTAERRGTTCLASVDDTGPGIPDEHLPFVFERFYRVSTSRSRDDGGTGIGLTIARSIVEAHGGRIWAERREGGGSRFRFELPLAVTRASGDDAEHAPRTGSAAYVVARVKEEA